MVLCCGFWGFFLFVFLGGLVGGIVLVLFVCFSCIYSSSKTSPKQETKMLCFGKN